MAKRLVQGIILFFALYAFAFMPLGKRTALEHMRAILATPEAKRAASELKGGATRLVQELRGDQEEALQDEPRTNPSRSLLRRDEKR